MHLTVCLVSNSVRRLLLSANSFFILSISCIEDIFLITPNSTSEEFTIDEIWEGYLGGLVLAKYYN